MNKHLGIALAVIAIVIAAWFAGRTSVLFEPGEPDTSDRQPPALSAPDVEPPRPNRSALERRPPDRTDRPERFEMKGQIAEAIETEVAPLNSRRDVERYLRELEDRARRKGEVSAVEVLPGLEAIEKVAGHIGAEKSHELMFEFTRKMEALSREFEGIEDVPLSNRFDDLKAGVIELEGAQQQEAIRDLLEAAQSSTPEEQAAAYQWLDKQVGAGAAGENPVDLDRLASEIEGLVEDDERKSQMIRQYLESARSLPPEKNAEAMHKLGRLFDLGDAD